MNAYAILALETLTFVAFVALAALWPYANRKRNYWTSKGLPTAPGQGPLSALPGCRLDDRALAGYMAAATPVVGALDAGDPRAVACDVRVAAAALADHSFAEPDRRPSLVPSTVNEDAAAAVLPTLTECVAELITSLEAVANRRLTVGPWAEVRKCASTAVATCVYGQPMIDSRMKAFAEQCDHALSAGRGRRPAVPTDYFMAYDLSADTRTTDFKQLLVAAAASANGGECCVCSFFFFVFQCRGKE